MLVQVFNAYQAAAGGGGGSPPAYVSTSSLAGNSLTPTYPASIAAGDFLLGAVAANGTADLDYSGPSGFTRLTHFRTADANGSYLAVFYKIADGSESGTATFTKNAGTANRNFATVSRFTGATKLESLVAGGTLDSSTVAISSPPVTTTGTGRLIVNLLASSAVVGLTEEAGWTEAFEYGDNGPGASDAVLALHYIASSGTGVQTTEEPTPSASSPWAVASLALCPSGSPAAPSISVRGSRITHVNNASSINFTLPPSSAAGDRCFIFIQHGFAISSTPTGWNLLVQQTGSNINGSVISKVLTPADITAGTVTISFGGAYYGQIAGVSFVGCTGGFRTYTSSRNSTGATSRSLTTSGQTPQSGDYALYFGSTRDSSSVCTVDVGSSLQAQTNTNAAACLYGRTLGSTGADSANFAYSIAGTGDFQAIVVVAA